MNDTLATLSQAGVSIWLDDLSRERLVSGSLADLAARDHVVGVTTNPSIFAKAISGSSAYDAQLQDLATRGVGTREALRALTTFDVRWACDVLRPVYDATGGVDGRVSIEVDPRLAYDTAATIAEARALWWLVDRPNLFIKIPAARQGYADHPGLPGRGNQHQHHADLLPGALRRGHGRLPRRHGRGPASRPRPVLDRVSRVLLRVTGGHRGRLPAGQDRDQRSGRAARTRGDRERPSRLPALREGVRHATLGRAAGGRGPAAAAAVGVHVSQGPGLSRYPLR